MLTREMAHQDLEWVDDAFATTADGGRELLVLPATQGGRAALARAQESEAIEAEDVLPQADEAPVMG